MKPTLALSVRQPWAWLIVKGYKPIENRTWQLPVALTLPQRIYIHAGKEIDWSCLPDIERIMTNGDGRGDRVYAYKAGEKFKFSMADNPYMDHFIGDIAHHKPGNAYDSTGGIVGEVDITGCVSISSSPWFEGPFGFTMINPVAYDKVIPIRGQLGFFKVEI